MQLCPWGWCLGNFAVSAEASNAKMRNVLGLEVFLLQRLNVPSQHGPAYTVQHVALQTARGHSHAATTTKRMLYLFYPGGRSRRPNQLSPKVMLHQIGRCTVRACLDHAYSRGYAGGSYRYMGRYSISTTLWRINLCITRLVLA